MAGSGNSSLSHLVLFMIVLAVAGSILAGVHYYAIDLPQQEKILPGNDACNDYCYTYCFCEKCEYQKTCKPCMMACYTGKPYP